MCESPITLRFHMAGQLFVSAGVEQAGRFSHLMRFPNHEEKSFKLFGMFPKMAHSFWDVLGYRALLLAKGRIWRMPCHGDWLNCMFLVRQVAFPRTRARTSGLFSSVSTGQILLLDTRRRRAIIFNETLHRLTSSDKLVSRGPSSQCSIFVVIR